MEQNIYNQQGKKSGTIKLPEKHFGLKWNADLVHQVVTSMMSSRRKGLAHVKERGEVAGGGRKPWQQKGTGRARHGSIRSPLWRKGGVTHGPRNEKNYARKVNDKMRRKALYTVISQKLRDGEVLFLDEIKMAQIKTKDAKGIVEKISSIKGYEKMAGKKKNAVMIALSKKDKNVEKSFQNFNNMSVIESRNLNPVDILNYKFLAIVNPEEYIKNL
ncbi:MAG: 50S ribosomal protein L4 [Patescibacteria group bacterium]